LNLQSLVNSRKRDYETFHQLQPLPDHLVTFGIPNLGNPYYPEVNEARTDSILTGLGACPGIVEAEAIVMLSPDTSTALNGQILVTRQTDPGWVVLFPSIRGLVVERGSMLSHSAIVAREMGIPAVVGVKGAVESIQSGNRLRIDGAKGTVEIIR
jgi:pyruvate,water dikinase